MNVVLVSKRNDKCIGFTVMIYECCFIVYVYVCLCTWCNRKKNTFSTSEMVFSKKNWMYLVLGGVEFYAKQVFN